MILAVADDFVFEKVLHRDFVGLQSVDGVVPVVANKQLFAQFSQQLVFGAGQPNRLHIGCYVVRKQIAKT